MGPLYKYLAICAILPLISSQCTYEVARALYTRSVYEFSTELLRRLAEETEGHFIASTLSPHTLLSAVALGASDETLSEIQRVLHLQKQKCFNNKFFNISKAVFTPDDSVTLERSGVVFVDDTVGLREVFRKRLSSTGICEVTPISFADFSAAAYRINDFVRSTTHGIIDEIVTPADLEGVFLMMIDALYFKGSWKSAFPVENTEVSPFYDSRGVQLGQVNMMYMEGEFNGVLLDTIKASIIELPYGNTNRYSMLLFLPYDYISLSTVIDNLKKISLRSVFRELSRRGPQSASVQLPRFKLTSDLGNLKELLTDMGLKEMFDPNLAKFPYVSDFQLYVSSFVQKADIEVTEEGTVAAAVTDLGMSYRSFISREEYNFNKPFLFMVVDRQTEVALFTGAYSKPSLY